jgi:AcrR family transcriptional regulator
MALTAPALYRYYRDRDALVDALVVEAFGSFADALEAARISRPAADHAGRMRAVAEAYRSWALSYPERYILIFQTPVAGYCIGEEAGRSGSRSFGVLLQTLQEAATAGALRVPRRYAANPAPLADCLERFRDGIPVDCSAVVVQLALATWSWIHGMVSLELGGQLPAFLGEQCGAVVAVEGERFLEDLGFGPAEAGGGKT